jgi:2-oxoglutarate ferredoxin oxidoreductase subunit beta
MAERCLPLWQPKWPIKTLRLEETYCDKIEFIREGLPLVDRPVDINKIKAYMKDFM